MKILFINQPISEYGQSFLYDGLRNLGHWVIDWPYNYRFHFLKKEQCNMDCKNGACSIKKDIGCNNHPAHLEWSSMPPFDSVPDLVITNNGFGNESIHRFMRSMGVPIAALDLGDSIHSSLDAWHEVLGGPPDFFFRREFIFGQLGHPLSYSFYQKDKEFLPTSKLEYSISYMFRPTNPKRIELAKQIQQIDGSFVGEVDHAKYLDILSKSKFSIAMHGAGFDTVRRWEIPCRGSVLCLEESPIIINNDFEDGVSCIKFKSSDELISKINYYLNNSDVYNKLRLNCSNHFTKYHTTTERARQFLKVCGYE